MGGDSCSKGREFKSRHHILDGHFFTYLFVVKFVLCVWKDKNKWKRGESWHIKNRPPGHPPCPNENPSVSGLAGHLPIRRHLKWKRSIELKQKTGHSKIWTYKLDVCCFCMYELLTVITSKRKLLKENLKKGLTCRAVWPEKIAKCLYNLSKNDFTRKMIDFNTFTKIA